ncbi:P-loop NTPase, partial [Eubacterium aggregans]|uniref:P-loop NTPase n=1 Tax=Eubacterium aggregans TaxID=81409 RepID=UPI003F3D3A90
RQETDFSVAPHPMSQVKTVIGVVSGKGGVGKSLVTSEMAVTMRRRGAEVGILDTDITGPSIPKAFGLTEEAIGSENGIYPVRTKTGIDVMSMNLLLENETDPVVWRGPVIAGAVKQFWSDVIWDHKEYLFVDMPPGTGDVPLTVFQSLPVDGISIVTSPQELVSMIVEKSLVMAQMMNVPVLGIVENMSYFKCHNCDDIYHIFGDSKIDEIAAANHVPVLAKVPIDTEIAKGVDAGNIEDYQGTWFDQAADVIEAL